MKLKRAYNVSFESEIAKQIETYKEKTGKSYTDIFLEGLKSLEVVKDE